MDTKIKTKPKWAAAAAAAERRRRSVANGHSHPGSKASNPSGQQGVRRVQSEPSNLKASLFEQPFVATPNMTASAAAAARFRAKKQDFSRTESLNSSVVEAGSFGLDKQELLTTNNSEDGSAGGFRPGHRFRALHTKDNSRDRTISETKTRESRLANIHSLQIGTRQPLEEDQDPLVLFQRLQRRIRDPATYNQINTQLNHPDTASAAFLAAQQYFSQRPYLSLYALQKELVMNADLRMRILASDGSV